MFNSVREFIELGDPDLIASAGLGCEWSKSVESPRHVIVFNYGFELPHLLACCRTLGDSSGNSLEKPPLMAFAE